MLMLPDDKNVLVFLAQQYQLRQDMQCYELMHMAGSFGKPGSLTEGGRKYKLAATEAAELNLRGVLYALKQGWISIDDINVAERPFGDPKFRELIFD